MQDLFPFNLQHSCLLTIDSSFSYQMSMKFGVHCDLCVVHSADL